MSKTKNLFKNIGFLVLSQFSIKLLSFLLLPLYTSVLSTSEYGMYDLFNTTVALLMPFLTLNIKDSTIRFALDSTEQEDLLKVFTISLTYVFLSLIPALVMLLVNHCFLFSKSIDDFSILVFLLFLSQSLALVVTNFVRGLDNLKEISISSVICSLTIIVLNIITLIPLEMGLYGYFVANIIGPIVQITYLFFKCKCWNYINFKKFDKDVNCSMLAYSRPLILNTTAWWVNSASDRYIVVLFCGTAVNGVYSVASKIPSILDMMQNIFAQAWTLSAVKEFDPNDTDHFFSDMYNAYNMAMTIMCSVIISASRVLAKFLYSKDFYLAWKYVPFLLVAVLFGALSGYIGAIFSAVKDARIFASSTLIGAGVNLFCNFVLVKFYGALGAAIATALCYWIIYTIRLQNSKKYIQMKLDIFRDYFAYVLLIVQTLLLYIFQEESFLLYFSEVGILFIIILLFNKETKKVFSMATSVKNAWKQGDRC